MSATKPLEIVECDEAGNVISTYIASGDSRVDVVLPKDAKNHAQKFLDVFLPAGYPHSVTEDYLQYQIYDSLQAFSSSIASLLSSRAVLQGVGVGDSTASPTTALLLSIVQDSLGRIATILFAHRLGSALSPECKTYRLAADIFNDAAMVLDCLSPVFPRPARVLLLSVSSCLRALCGVCAGSAKASLSAHFARKGNLGELNAKDASQETVVSLLGMLAGSVVVSFVTGPGATWATLGVLLGVHLGMNYMAVRAVRLTSLNRQRANIVFSRLLRGDGEARVLSPSEVAEEERIFERDGVLRCIGKTDGVLGRNGDMSRRDNKNDIVGYCKIGVSMHTLLSRINTCQRTQSGAFDALPIKMADLLDIFSSEGYILWLPDGPARTKEALIVLKKDCTALDQLQAWLHAWLLVQQQQQQQHETQAHLTGRLADHKNGANANLAQLRSSLALTRQVINLHAPALSAAGWNLETCALETRAGVRAAIAIERRTPSSSH